MGLDAEIKSVVNWDAPSVDINESLQKVIQHMVDYNTSALVVKMNDEVVGIVSDMDVMDCIINDKDQDAIKTSECMSACELIKDVGVKTPCAQLHESESAKSALMVMSSAGVHHLLIAGEKKAGLVSVKDLLKLAIE